MNTVKEWLPLANCSHGGSFFAPESSLHQLRCVHLEPHFGNYVSKDLWVRSKAERNECSDGTEPSSKA